jgi:phosphohistidine phosphatase
MKSITFIRHAKSSWQYKLPDEKRPLNKRGLFDAEFMSSLAIIKSIQPDAVFCSSAERTRETCNFFLRNAVSSGIEVAYSEDLYDFSGSSVEAFIKRINPKLSKVFIFGHNNALTALVNQMGNQHIDNIPTCGIVKINFKSKTWRDCSKGTIEFQLFPKNLTP